MQSGHYDALESILAIIRRDAPQIATALGLTS
jgi:hypothetical protein